jgi:hypothetical protein
MFGEKIQATHLTTNAGGFRVTGLEFERRAGRGGELKAKMRERSFARRDSAGPAAPARNLDVGLTVFPNFCDEIFLAWFG